MGIPGFFRWLQTNPATKYSVTKTLPDAPIDILALDLNGIIHDVTQHTFKYGRYEKEKLSVNLSITKTKNKIKVKINKDDYDHLIQVVYETVFSEIVGLVETVAPREMLLIAIDGVAPQSKILQQRGRRYTSAADRDPTNVFDSTAITPGTEFMFGLDAFLRSRLQQAPVQHNFPKIVYSSHMSPGEGEHKIADILRELDVKNKTLMIHGADADLNMIYLTQLYRGWSNIYLFRESFVGKYYPENVIDLKSLSNVITEKYTGALNPLDDFVVVMSLLGNDFLPHFPGFESTGDAINAMFDGYSQFLQTSQGIVELQNISWTTLGKFIQFMKSKYEDMLISVTSDTRRVPFPPAERSKIFKQITVHGRSQQVAVSIDKFNANWYPYAMEGKASRTNVTDSDKQAMLNAYLGSVNWIYHYYKTGVATVNPEWYYPYFYTPVFEDLISFIEMTNAKLWTEPSERSGQFVNCLHQLLMVLPSKSSGNAPKEIQRLFNKTSPIADMFPSSFQSDISGKLKIRKNGEPTLIGIPVPLVPIPTVPRVLDAMNNLKIPKKKEFLKRFDNVESLVIDSTSVPVRRATAPPVTRGRGRGRGSSRGRGRGRGSFRNTGFRGPPINSGEPSFVN